MGGSKTITYTDLQVERIIDDPEKMYENYMRQAYKNIGYGMKAVMSEFQNGIIDTRSLFHNTYLANMGYEPKEKITYKVVDPVLVENWIKTNISNSVSEIISYKWGVPTLEEIVLEYLQDTYTGMNIEEKSFIIDEVRWYISGITSVGAGKTNATCYRDKNITVAEYIVKKNEEKKQGEVDIVLVSIEDVIYKTNGINYWRASLTNGTTIDIPIEYITIECPGTTSEVIQSVIDSYNGRLYPVQSNETYTDSETGSQAPYWTSDVRISVYLDANGDIKITGKIVNYSVTSLTGSKYLEAKKEAVAGVLGIARKEIDATTMDDIDRLVVVYRLNGIIKLVIAEINESEVINTAQAEAFPIIPIKNNKKFSKETNQMKAMLNKLGMARDDFEKSLSDKKINNAAILFLLDIRDKSEIGTKVVYETLSKMVRTTIPASGKTAATSNYQLSLGFKNVNIKSSISFDLKTASGVVCPVGSYKRYSRQEQYEYVQDFGDSQSTSVATGRIYGIRKQVSENYYEEMEFKICSTNWIVGGYELRGELSLESDKGKVYIPITDVGLAGLSYKHLHYAIARSMSLMVLSVVKVKMKWYQSGFFKFLLIIVIAVAAFFTGGWAAYLGAGLGILGVMGVDFGSLGLVIQVVLAVYTMGASLTSASASTGAQVLATANSLVKLASIASTVNSQGAARSLEARSRELDSQIKGSEEELKKLEDSTQQGLWMGISDRDPELMYAMSSTTLMCNYDILYDYDGMYENKIRSVGI